MKHIIIGDLHGLNNWEQVKPRKCDRLVFLGDYVDSFNRPNFIILDNLINVIELKKKNPENVILLLGNHDVQYLHYPKYYCPGFRPTMQPQLTRLFTENRKLFQIGYQHRNSLFTHAGITNKWYRSFSGTYAYRLLHHAGDTVADTINRFERETQNSGIYAYSRYRTGHDSDGGPLWADLQETWADSLNGYHQFVGHTPREQPTVSVYRGKSITYLDVLHRHDYFHEIHI